MEFCVDENNNINKINFITYYNTSPTSRTLIVYTGTLATPLNLETIKDKDFINSFENSLDNLKYNRIYTLSFNPTIQKENGELTNAIFDKMGVEETHGQRIIVETGHTSSDSTLGEVNQFQVVEIGDSKIVEYFVRIASSNSIEEYINQLNNGNYREYSDMQEYELGGKPFVKTGGAE